MLSKEKRFCRVVTWRPLGGLVSGGGFAAFVVPMKKPTGWRGQAVGCGSVAGSALELGEGGGHGGAAEVA